MLFWRLSFARAFSSSAQALLQGRDVDLLGVVGEQLGGIRESHRLNQHVGYVLVDQVALSPRHAARSSPHPRPRTRSTGTFRRFLRAARFTTALHRHSAIPPSRDRAPPGRTRPGSVRITCACLEIAHPDQRRPVPGGHDLAVPVGPPAGDVRVSEDPLHRVVVPRVAFPQRPERRQRRTQPEGMPFPLDRDQGPAAPHGGNRVPDRVGLGLRCSDPPVCVVSGVRNPDGHLMPRFPRRPPGTVHRRAGVLRGPVHHVQAHARVHRGEPVGAVPERPAPGLVPHAVLRRLDVCFPTFRSSLDLDFRPERPSTGSGPPAAPWGVDRS